jgi:thiol-disulfide isomerase/thioredoxin
MTTKQLNIGATAPSFRNLPGVDGKSYSLDTFRSNTALVIVFSCNHCPYVQAYEDRMIAFQKEYGGKGVQLIAINSNETQNYPEDNFDEMLKRSRAHGFTFPYLCDEDQAVAEAFGATHTPEFFVFDGGEGSVRRLRYHGKMDDNYRDPGAVTRRYLHEAVDAILAGKSVKDPETHSIGCTIKWRH